MSRSDLATLAERPYDRLALDAEAEHLASLRYQADDFGAGPETLQAYARALGLVVGEPRPDAQITTFEAEHSFGTPALLADLLAPVRVKPRTRRGKAALR